MNRLQKKCFIASAGFHLLLATILVVGPAFLSSSSRTVDVPLIDFVPVKTVDALVSGGGNPKAQPPGAAVRTAPPQPAQPVQPAQTPPEPAPNEIKEPQRDPDSFEIGKERKHKIEVNTTLVRRKANARSDAQARAAAEAKAIEDQRRRAAAAIGQTVAGIESGLSGTTTIELKGPGGGGVPYANFLQAVKSVYSRAWILPDGATDDSATTTASVTIARDGTVVSARITRFSGNATVDDSVQRTLDRVRYAAPLPDDAKEDQRTVSIDFNAKAKQALG